LSCLSNLTCLIIESVNDASFTRDASFTIKYLDVYNTEIKDIPKSVKVLSCNSSFTEEMIADLAYLEVLQIPSSLADKLANIIKKACIHNTRLRKIIVSGLKTQTLYREVGKELNYQYPIELEGISSRSQSVVRDLFHAQLQKLSPAY